MAVAASEERPRLPELKQPTAVPVSPMRAGGAKKTDAAATGWKDRRVAWPAAGSAEVYLASTAVSNSFLSDSAKARIPAAGPGAGRAGMLPVSVRPLQAEAAETPSKVKVTLAGKDAARKAGIDGVLLSVGRSDGGQRAAAAQVEVDYTSFRGAYGGDYASRLRLVELPACAMTQPELPKCRTQKPLSTRNDTRAGKLSAQVSMPGASEPTARPAGAPAKSALAPAKSALAAADPAGATVLAATAGPSGQSGDYKATPLKPSGSWSAGGVTGSFNWSYPIDVPAVPEDLKPGITLGYSSQSVDGLTAASNNQPSWLGDGWSYEPGFVERRYKSCNDDKTGGTNTTKVGDQCWFNDNATLHLGGKSTELVYQAGKGWHTEGNGAEKIEKLTGASNGDQGTAGVDGVGEHWKVTTPDGTQYFFGLNRLPGWKDNGAAADDPVTNSAWTAPVFGNQSGEPCYNAAFANGWCQQAWRWQLDYVVAPGGGAMAYYWNTESNNYGRNVSETTGKATVTTYVRGGWLDRIDYGLRSDAVYTGKAMGQVEFDVTERCLTNCGTFDEANAKNWPDVPFDLYCKDGATECKDQYSPSFWSRKRLAKITTKLLTGGTYKDVDSWTLEQDFPASGDGISTPMWLKSIQHTGLVGGTLATPPVTFAGEQRANRVDKLGDGLAPFVRLRMYQITTETGGTIGATYSQPGCTSTTLPTPDGSNKTSCFPVKWAYEGETAKLDWFNTYTVDQVVEGDNLAESPDKVISYSYLDGAAWAKSTDEFTKAEDRVHSVARGYERVQTRTGAASDPRTLTETRYFRGLDGQAVRDSAGAAVTDREQFAGMTRETATYNGDDTAKLVSATSYTPWRSSAVATRTRAGLPDLVSYQTGTEQESVRTPGAGGTRTVERFRTFDGYGMVTSESSTGDKDKAGDESCTTTEYARDTGTGILNKVSRVESVAVACGAAVSRPGDIVDDVRTYYDKGALGTVPGRGLVTRTERINGKGDGYDVQAEVPSLCGADGKQLCADVHGRVLKAADAYGKITTTAYTPATGEAPTSTVATNPRGHATTTVLEPLRGQATQTTDANSKITTSAYDALGRVSKVWLPTRSATTYPDSPNYVFDYLVRNDGPIVTTSKVLTHDATYKSAYAFADGLLRTRQTQEPSQDGAGRIVSETFYDTRGLAWRTSGSYFATGAAEPVLVTGQELKYPASTDTEYDGAGRVTAVISKRFGDETKRTTTQYAGDSTTVIPPQGGTAVTAVADALGRTVEQRQYTDDARTAFQSTLYTYNKVGKLAQVTDPSNAKWTYTYDVRGRQIQVDDPDEGTTKSVFDQGDRITDITDARQVTLHSDYDELGRRTVLKKGTTTLATWEFDTVAKGHAAKSTRWANGKAYESAITSYNSRYQPVGQQVTIPDSEGALAGTYKWINSYNAHTGQVMWVQHPAAGGLPQEKVNNTYTAGSGLLGTVYAGTDAIISGNTYDHYGRNVRQEFGEFAQHLWVSKEYDEHTGALHRSYIDREAAPQRIEDVSYSYDALGNITSIASAFGQDSARTTDTQCFALDELRRITEAWTNTGTACAGAPSTSAVGGPDAYWTTYTYDAVGNRKTETKHKTASGPTDDTLRTYAAPAAGKHNLPKVTQTGTSPRDEVFTYDASGNVKTRKIGSAAQQTLTWDDEGHLGSVVQGTNTSSYLYGTAGERLIHRDSTGTTLTLPGGNELKLDKAGTTVTGTRYYSVAGQTVAMRTGGKLTFVIGDHHGTGTTQVSADAAQTVVRRKTGIFGEERGAQPAGWAGDKGFVGGTKDADTGLTHLGAREYDPAIGRFVSVDPLMDLSDPQQTHGYTYSNNNPVSLSDPSGLKPIECMEHGYTCKYNGGGGWSVEEKDYTQEYNGYTKQYAKEDHEERKTHWSKKVRDKTRKKRLAYLAQSDEVDVLVRFQQKECAKMRGLGRAFCGIISQSQREMFAEKLFGDDLDRIDEGWKDGGQDAFTEDEFDLAFQLAREGHTVVSRGENIAAPGAEGNKRFDAWVDGIRSEFKILPTEKEKGVLDQLSDANKKGADRLYIKLKNIGEDEGRAMIEKWSKDPRRTVKLSTIFYVHEDGIEEINFR
ncbi:RHS repeat domain-containing protein [Streptomyces sp. NBC_00094]|uniref:RHS repeat domain-containing protein n=1 Tax=Streptomyces sp. NBC_00094 TaxID=2903620 RepID=UPI00224FBDF4|nr:RHS repeat-associated core domain-containing protein [Streptomyces sp. NBC_00094]MCX5389091.1 RHS repeat-associated core domain-containing protein [Streptomyces sp. NBC_00094]